MSRFLCATALTLVLVGCGGTHVGDEDNFERVFGFECPEDVQLVNSIHWKSAHFTEEHCYFLELRPTPDSKFAAALIATPDYVLATEEKRVGLSNFVVGRPAWFAPKPRDSYDEWVWLDGLADFGFLRDKSDGRIFVYGQIL